jgi:hypothetical protein
MKGKGDVTENGRITSGQVLDFYLFLAQLNLRFDYYRVLGRVGITCRAVRSHSRSIGIHETVRLKRDK